MIFLMGFLFCGFTAFVTFLMAFQLFGINRDTSDGFIKAVSGMMACMCLVSSILFLVAMLRFAGIIGVL